jgi:NAD(P)H-dependent flavin oxidoreductase YrpB (nitropropane dioxygenase family)
MKEYLSFDDVLISPQFSIVKSRKDVDTTSFGLSVPIISSNMDTVTGPKMVKAMTESGGAGCLHRFCNIEDNVKMFHEAREMITINHGDGTYTNTQANPWVSIGLGRYELERAEALFNAGADTFVIDVAHGAAMLVTSARH